MAATALDPFLPPWLRTATGTLSVDEASGDGAFGYARAGDAERPLLVLPGFGDAMFDGRYPPQAGPALTGYFARYLGEHEVYLLSRPRGLQPDYTIERAAVDHAALLDAHEELAPANVLGVSMGGMIGLELAARRPELVDRLVVADAAYRLGDAGREPAERMLQRALEHDWTAIRSELASGLFADWRQFAYPAILQTVGRFVQPRPADPADVPASLSAILAYDGRDALVDVDHPTLVIGGSRDPYFTRDVMAETAEALPDGRLSLLEGAKHGAFHERKLSFDERVTEFLS